MKYDDKKGLYEEKIAISRVYGVIPTFIAAILALGIIFYYDSGLLSSLIVVFIFIILSYRVFVKAEIFKYYRNMRENQKKLLFIVILWEISCFGTPWLISKNGSEYLINVFIFITISGMLLYIGYILFIRKNFWEA